MASWNPVSSRGDVQTILKNCQEVLLDTLDLGPTLLSKLERAEVITRDVKDRLTAPTNTRMQKIRHICESLRGPDSFRAFCKVLENDEGHRFVLAEMGLKMGKDGQVYYISVTDSSENKIPQTAGNIPKSKDRDPQPGTSETGSGGQFEKAEKSAAETGSEGQSIKLEVKKSTNDFYKDNRDATQAYEMRGAVRGPCLILNLKFTGQGKNERHGTDKDRDVLKDLFNQLHFDVIVRNDDEVALSAQYAHIFDRPSIRWVQACDGREHDTGIHTTSALEEGQSLRMDGTATSEIIPKKADYFAAYAGPSGEGVFRKTTAGSYFMQAIAQVFAEHAWRESLTDLMMKVNSMVSKRNMKAGDETVKQMPNQDVYLRRKLFFFPGITQEEN